MGKTCVRTSARRLSAIFRRKELVCTRADWRVYLFWPLAKNSPYVPYKINTHTHTQIDVLTWCARHLRRNFALCVCVESTKTASVRVSRFNDTHHKYYYTHVFFPITKKSRSHTRDPESRASLHLSQSEIDSAENSLRWRLFFVSV